jgi:hypothetical protein
VLTRLVAFAVLALLLPSSFIVLQANPNAVNITSSIKAITSTAINLVPFNKTAKSTASPIVGQASLDMGTDTLHYAQTGISMMRSDGNITIGNPSVVTMLTPSTFKNSTHIDYRYSSVGFTMDTFVKNTSNPYQKKFLMTGTATPSATLSIPLLNPNNLAVSVCDTGCTVQCFGTMCFDWSDSPSFTYNNATDVLSIVVTGSFVIDPIATDGSGNCNASASTCNASVTTSNSNDILIMGESIHATSNAACTSPTSSPSLTWTVRQTAVFSGTVNRFCYYYTVWTSSGSITITCNSSGTAPTVACHDFGISGASIGNCGSGGTTCFDTNANAKCVGTASGVSPVSCNVSTTNPNDMIIGIMTLATTGTNTISAGSNFALIGSCANLASTEYNCSEDDIVSSTQTNLAVGFSWTGSGTGNIFGDSIIAGAQAFVTTFSPSITLVPSLQMDTGPQFSKTITLLPTLQFGYAQSFSPTITLAPVLSTALATTLNSVVSLQPSLSLSTQTGIRQVTTTSPFLAIAIFIMIVGMVILFERKRR